MNSIVERLRGFKSAAAQAWSQEAADLIEQQAERIKELEAGIQIAKHNEQCTHDANVNLCKELAALRQRIDDAHVHDKRFRMTFSGVQEISLICREDLK